MGRTGCDRNVPTIARRRPVAAAKTSNAAAASSIRQALTVSAE